MDKERGLVVSIIAPCFNVEKYLGAFLDSVLLQTYPYIELILIDDGSTDGTAEIIRDYKSRFECRRIGYQYIRSGENKGAAAAINLGLPIFQGDFLMWVDSDDILYPENISEKVQYLLNNPDKDFVLCQQELVDENDINNRKEVWKRTRTGENDPLAEDLLRGKNVVYGPGVILVRRESFEKAHPTKHIYESRQGQNYQMLLPLAYCCKCGYIDKVLMKYVFHPDSHAHLKRTHKEKITRQKEFMTLIEETLTNTPGMTKDDYESLTSIAAQMLYSNELRAHLESFCLLSYWKLRRKMRQKEMPVHRNLKPVVFYGRFIKRRILGGFVHK